MVKFEKIKNKLVDNLKTELKNVKKRTKDVLFVQYPFGSKQKATIIETRTSSFCSFAIIVV